MDIVKAEFPVSTVEQIDLSTVAEKLLQKATLGRKAYALLNHTTVADLNIIDAFDEAARLFGERAYSNMQFKTIHVTTSDGPGEDATVYTRTESGLVHVAGIRRLHVAFETLDNESAPPLVDLGIKPLEGVGRNSIEAKKNFLAVLFGLCILEHSEVIRDAYESGTTVELTGNPLLFVARKPAGNAAWTGRILQPAIPEVARRKAQVLFVPTQP